MKTIFLLALTLLLSPFCAAQVKLNEATTIEFASVEKGREILSTRDDFVERLSPFDRAARLKVEQEVNEKDFLAFVQKNVLAWQQEETKIISSICQTLAPALSKLNGQFPKTIYFVKTTGAEEGQAPYTRGVAIILPRRVVRSQRELPRIIVHELFHVLSRHNPELRKNLYGVIGFQKCAEVTLPPELARRKITNPDAPKNDHAIRVSVEGESLWVIPVLISESEKYSVERGGEFFEYLQLQFLVISTGDNLNNVKPYDGKNPRLLAEEELSGFYEQVGTNTEYIIHPEEILADNFALLILGGQQPESPELLERLRKILFRQELLTFNFQLSSSLSCKLLPSQNLIEPRVNAGDVLLA